MKHPLRDLSLLNTRDRVRSAIGMCTSDVDPDAHADRITERVLHVRFAGSLDEDLHDRARRFADQTKSDGLETGGR